MTYKIPEIMPLCQCGCNQRILFKKIHKWRGIPKYIRGHCNAKHSFEERQRAKNKSPSMIQHHIKYKEIHGVEEIVTMKQSEHVKLHQRLRKEGKCTLSVVEISKMSRSSYWKRSMQTISFYETVMPNVTMLELYHYNINTGKVTFENYFKADNHKHLFYIDVD
jgi:hypothetical protein